MNQDTLWDYHQNEGLKFVCFSKARQIFLLRHLLPGQVALNIGVGDGTLERLAQKKNVDIHSLDPSRRTIERLRHELNLGEKAQVGYSQSMPFSNQQFNVVVMCEVLEHLNDESIEATLSDVFRLLKPGGFFIGTVPADENLSDNQVFCPYCSKQFHRWGHFQSFSHSKLEKLLSSQFADVRVRRIYLSDWDELNWKGKIAWLIKQGLLSMGVAGSGENFFFKGVRK